MNNQNHGSKGIVALILNFFFGLFGIYIGIFVVLIAFFFGIYLIFTNTLLGVVYFLIPYLVLKWWEKKQRAKDENIKKMNDSFIQLAQIDAADRKERARVAYQKDAQRRLEKFKKMPIWKQKGYKSSEEYLAEKERKLRKREELLFLAKAYKQRTRRKKIKSNLSTIDSLISLTPIDFEKWVRKHVFEKDGWKVEETRTTGDGGIDLTLRKNGEYSIAQCKRFRKTVGEPALRDFYGTMMSEGVSRGYFITTGLFTLSAQKFADEKPIVLIDRSTLVEHLS